MADSTWSVRAPPPCDGSTPVQKAPHALAICCCVMTGEPRASARTGSAAILGAVLCAALSCAEPALAGPVDSLRQAFSHHPNDGQDVAAASVGRYVSEDGDGFTLDRTGSKALLKFDGSFEVWALTPQQAPRPEVNPWFAQIQGRGFPAVAARRQRGWCVVVVGVWAGRP